MRRRPQPHAAPRRGRPAVRRGASPGSHHAPGARVAGARAGRTTSPSLDSCAKKLCRSMSREWLSAARARLRLRAQTPGSPWRRAHLVHESDHGALPSGRAAGMLHRRLVRSSRAVAAEDCSDQRDRVASGASMSGSIPTGGPEPWVLPVSSRVEASEVMRSVARCDPSCRPGTVHLRRRLLCPDADVSITGSPRIARPENGASAGERRRFDA